MAGDESENQGLFEAHTPRENPDRAAKVGSTRASIEADMADLAGQLQRADEPEQQSLLLDEIDETVTIFGGPVKHVANQLDEHRRGRGRPRGSQNKASREFRDTLLRMGFKHPGLNLAALANADPVKLAEELSVDKLKDGVVWRVGCSPAEAMQMILKANAELLPYFESKQAQPIDPGEARVMGVMVIGQVSTGPAEQAKTIDLTRFDRSE
ncbi:hypothetical protein [Rhizobium sp. 12,4]|uniref:hypothetical protein n=1 Tax=Rhizobium sp. 12,4 TaxID=3405135 RepID=UPI003D35492D